MININKFSVLFLSAGIGKRLGKIGKIQPKCLLKIKNISLIEKIIFDLKTRGVTEINIILGYKSDMIIKTLKKIKNIKFNFIIIKDFQINGHACSWHSFKKDWFKKKNHFYYYIQTFFLIQNF